MTVGDFEDGRSKDRELVARLSGGDEAALAELYDRHAGSLYALARSIVRDADDAEEVVGDVFVMIWTRPSAYAPERGSVGAFLAVATRSRALDRVRASDRRGAAMRRVAAVPDDSAPALGAAAPSPQRAVERSELGEAVSRVLDSLPEAQRLALVLAFFQGLSHSEIAAELSEPLGTVKTRIRDGMRKLRAAMAPFGPEEGP